MSLLNILVAPDPRLKNKALPVEKVDSALSRLIDDMFETMYQAPGIGLAAPQVGVAKKVIVVDTAKKGEEAQPMALINPEILWLSEETSSYEEGCLSVPEHYAEVIRPARVRVRYQDRQGEIREIEADGLLSTVLQHEIDHLSGKLFVDYLSALKRGMILRKLEKAKKQAVRG
ncbi:peptide deformylase [Rhodospirillaceae bacterium LM-1]|nr:peptide deformylase [Rhodospirillaceae bacterium LM-1]